MAFKLAVNLDQSVTDLTQQTDGYRLIVDKGAGTPIGIDHPAQDQILVETVQPLIFNRQTGGMIGGRIEDGSHTKLRGTVPDHAGFRTCPQSQSQ